MRMAAVLIACAAAVRPLASQAPTVAVPPVTLEQVLRGVVDRHPLVEAAEARERAARGARLTARLPMNPVFTYWVENAGFPGRPAPAGLVQETAVYGTLPLDPLWQRWSHARRAGNEVKAAEADVHLVQRDVALDAARAFHRVALAQVAVEGAQDIRERLDSLVRFNQARLDEGVAAEGDLIRIQVERDRAGTELALQKAELARARGELFPFLDDATRSSVTVASLTVVPDDSVVGVPIVLPSVAELTAKGLQLRPDVVAAQARARAASAGVGYQRSLMVRQLGATFGTKSVGGSRSMIVGLSVPIPLFDQNLGEIGRAAGERTAAERELAWTERRATAEIAAAYEAASVLTEQVHRLEQGFLARAEESRRIALAAYQEGAAPLFQVIDATRTLGEARLSFYRAVFAERESLLELHVAAGLDPLAPFLEHTNAPGADAESAPTGVIR